MKTPRMQQLSSSSISLSISVFSTLERFLKVDVLLRFELLLVVIVWFCASGERKTFEISWTETGFLVFTVSSRWQKHFRKRSFTYWNKSWIKSFSRLRWIFLPTLRDWITLLNLHGWFFYCYLQTNILMKSKRSFQSVSKTPAVSCSHDFSHIRIKLYSSCVKTGFYFDGFNSSRGRPTMFLHFSLLSTS